MSTLVQSIGLGGLKPNTMLLSWPTHDRGEHELADSEYQTFTGEAIVIVIFVILNVFR